MKQRAAALKTYPVRRFLVMVMFAAGMVVLGLRAVELQVFNHDFLQGQATERHIRVVSKASVRGNISDRNGEPLAISTPVDTIWMNPKEASKLRPDQVEALSSLLTIPEKKIYQKIAENPNREFLYLKRRLPPEDAKRVLDLDLPGIHSEREYQRFYPTGEVFAHVIGFTGIDGNGLEGVELAYEDHLTGTPGKRRVVKDGRGRIIDEVAMVRASEPGEALKLTIDRRIQYLAYRELKLAVKANKAKSGSVVVLDPTTGEILAMVNQPSFNPNNRREFNVESYRNRAIKDVFEPGSTAKPFTIAAALETGAFLPGSVVDTNPGRYRVTGHTIKDPKNYGRIDLGTILSKSSNVGASKVAMQIQAEELWDIFQRVGFGQISGIGFPGESGGVLRDFTQWYPVDQATLSFGYGFSVTPLQLASAYSVLANDGKYSPIKIIKGEDSYHEPESVLREDTAKAVRLMMEKVVAPSGTGYMAAVDGYRVAGKTGTSKKAAKGGYSEDHYVAVFAGMAPVENPRLVTVVMINDPRGEEYYGGRVAGPVFSRIMTGALRQMNVPPDNWSDEAYQAISAHEGGV